MSQLSAFGSLDSLLQRAIASRLFGSLSKSWCGHSSIDFVVTPLTNQPWIRSYLAVSYIAQRD
jgi:hypothetical protein